VTHGALCPVDVVKTRMQLDPVKYSGSMIKNARLVVAEEGIGALATGLGPTFVGYSIQGFFKFGGVEVFKIQLAQSMGIEAAWANRTKIYLASAAMAEFVADVFLTPLEATRIKLVNKPDFANSMPAAMIKVVQQEGFLTGFYSGFIPILFKQVPYTMAKFAVQGFAQEQICNFTGKFLDCAKLLLWS